MKIILFGPPGVGKSFVGKLFADEHGLTFYDGDTDYTPQERVLLANGQWNDRHRKMFLTRIASRINQLDTESPTGIIIPIAMTRQWMRNLLEELCGPITWVLVKAALPPEQLETKIITRREEEGHPITTEAFRKFTEQFELPTFPHFTLENPHDEKQKADLVENIRRTWQQINHLQ